MSNSIDLNETPLGVSSGSKLFAYGNIVMLGSLRVTSFIFSIRFSDTTRDAVVFYADTEPARKDAIRFKRDVKDFMPEATLSLEEELGLGGLTELDAKVEATKTHRYIFILMTEDLPEDPLVKFAAGMLLDHFIKKQQDRVVPIWFSADRDRFPLYLSTLRGHNYYLMRNQANDIRQLCINGFKKLINNQP